MKVTKSFWHQKHPKLHRLKVSKYPKRSAYENRLISKHPYADTDRDGVMNWYDCKPKMRKKQDFISQAQQAAQAAQTVAAKVVAPAAPVVQAGVQQAGMVGGVVKKEFKEHMPSISLPAHKLPIPPKLPIPIHPKLPTPPGHKPMPPIQPPRYPPRLPPEYPHKPLPPKYPPYKPKYPVEPLPIKPGTKYPAEPLPIRPGTKYPARP